MPSAGRLQARSWGSGPRVLREPTRRRPDAPDRASPVKSLDLLRAGEELRPTLGDWRQPLIAVKLRQNFNRSGAMLLNRLRFASGEFLQGREFMFGYGELEPSSSTGRLGPGQRAANLQRGPISATRIVQFPAREIDIAEAVVDPC